MKVRCALRQDQLGGSGLVLSSDSNTQSTSLIRILELGSFEESDCHGDLN